MVDFAFDSLTGKAVLKPGTYRLVTDGNEDMPWGGPVAGTDFTVTTPSAPVEGADTPGDKGPAGDKGPDGDKGPVGDRGPAGDAGIGGVVQGDFTAAVQAAFAADRVLNWSGADATLTAPIVLDVTQWKFGFGIRLNGAQVINMGDGPALHIRVPVVNGAVVRNVGMRNFVLSDGHFFGGYGALRMECRSNGSWLGLGNISTISCDAHTGYAVELLGSVFEGEVSRVTTTNGLGAFHARTCGLVDPDPNATDGDKGLPSALYITMPDFRDGTSDAVLLSSATPYQEPFDLTVKDGYIVTNGGSAIVAPAGLKKVEGTGVENNHGDTAIFVGYRGGEFKSVTGANPVAMPAGQYYPLISAALANGTVVIEDCGIQNEGPGTGAVLCVVSGGGGKVYLNRSGTAADVIVGGIPPAAVVTVAQYS